MRCSRKSASGKKTRYSSLILETMLLTFNLRCSLFAFHQHNLSFCVPSATAWSGIDGRIKPDLSPVSFSMLGLNTTGLSLSHTQDLSAVSTLEARRSELVTLGKISAASTEWAGPRIRLANDGTEVTNNESSWFRWLACDLAVNTLPRQLDTEMSASNQPSASRRLIASSVDAYWLIDNCHG